jgi:hypothetical protein
MKTIDADEFKKLEDAFEDAKKKFDDGDIDYAELDVAKDAFNEARWKKDFAEESNTSMRENRWQWEQDSFLNAEENNQYRDNETLSAAFIATVNKLIATDDGKAMTDRQVLEAAKDKVEKDLGGVRTKAGGGEETAAEKTARLKQEAVDKAKKKAGDKTKIQLDLTDVPAAEENVDTGEFDLVDNLEGEALQAAVDRMTPAQLERYENAQ